MKSIVIRGARQHNLKNVDLSIPRNRLVVITGVSGSGKSSLAFDTLFAEGQRRYVEALSTFARHFLQRLNAPQVDEIQGLSPAIAIEQKGLPGNPRSTVGTLTEIYDYLRILYARLGKVYCPDCGEHIKAYSIPEMVQEIFQWPAGSRLLILAPLGRYKARQLSDALKKLRRDGFARVRLDGAILELDPLPAFPRRPSHRLEVVVDRLVLSETKSRRFSDSLQTASQMGGGTVSVLRLQGEEKTFTETFRCTACGKEVPQPTPSLFSFHHPSGMCPVCNGLGRVTVAADRSAKPAAAAGRRSREQSAAPVENDAESPSNSLPCPACHGARLNELARAVRLADLAIHELTGLAVPALQHWLESLHFSEVHRQIANRPLQEIYSRLRTMQELGLAYLTLDRSADTLSGGEAQRIRLAHQISAPLSGILYVLDEPSIGLHPRDHQQLLTILLRLRDAGNSVVVVEHDKETILQADYVVDMGPGAGVQGGELVFCGTPQQLAEAPSSLTGRYLAGLEKVADVSQRAPFQAGALHLIGARGNNLKDLSVDFPLGNLTCVTGVSGSGKSTLVIHTLYRALARHFYRSQVEPAPFRRLENVEALQKVILVDQSPLGRTPRSTPATYTNLFALIRGLFARLPEARARAYGPGRFSFNTRGGRCEACKGEGLQRIEMFFLPDIYVTCPICRGSRYDEETLEIRFKGRSIAEVLQMTVHEASAWFENIPALRYKFQALQEVGLGYLQLGQPANTLSGGEAQRVKLAAELGLKTVGKTLYILDEPTTGLHFDDIRKLLHVLQRLVERGHSVVMIEHHLDVIKAADYIIDLGPGGGDEGGHVVVAGTPQQVAQAEDSATGRYLRTALAD